MKMGVLFVLLAAFFFHTEGVVSNRKDDAKVKESAERVRKSIWCGPRGCFLDLESKNVRRSYEAGAPGTSGDFIGGPPDLGEPYDTLSEPTADWHSCPQIYCPMHGHIPEPCRRSRYVLGADGITRCRVCDISTCGYINVCPPHPPCPNDELIPDECRVPRYTTGIDGRQQCRLCDESSCGYTRPK